MVERPKIRKTAVTMCRAQEASTIDLICVPIKGS